MWSEERSCLAVNLQHALSSASAGADFEATHGFDPVRNPKRRPPITPFGPLGSLKPQIRDPV